MAGVLLVSALLLGIMASRPLYAGALASASMSISQLSWYWVGPDGIGNDPALPSSGADDLLLSVVVPGAAPTGNEQLVINQSLADDDAIATVELKINGIDKDQNVEFGNRFQGITSDPADVDLASALDIPRQCVPPLCSGGPSENDFSPLASSLTNNQYLNSDLLLNSFWLNASNVPSADGQETGGIRADVSLPVLDVDDVYQGDGTAELERQSFVVAQAFNYQGVPYNQYDTYFKIDGVSQAMARLSSDEQPNSVAEARLSFLLTTLTGPSYTWEPDELNLLAEGGSNTGAAVTDPDGGSFTAYSHLFEPTPGSRLGALRMTAGDSYIVSLRTEARVRTIANSPPVGTPIPVAASSLLILAGLSSLWAVRRRAASSLSLPVICVRA